jgi:hypothetical protein
MRALTSRLALVALVGLVLGPTSSAGVLRAEEQDVRTPAHDVAYAEQLSVQPGPLAGKVLYTDGKSPASEAAVRLWSPADEAFLCETQTAADGSYALPELEPGRYLAIFADRVLVELTVSEEAENAGDALNVIVPRGEAVFAQMAPQGRAAVLSTLAQPEDAPESAIAAMPLRTVLIVAGGTATAIGIVSVVENTNDDDGSVVSP